MVVEFVATLVEGVRRVSILLKSKIEVLAHLDFSSVRAKQQRVICQLRLCLPMLIDFPLQCGSQAELLPGQMFYCEPSALDQVGERLMDERR